MGNEWGPVSSTVSAEAQVCGQAVITASQTALETRLIVHFLAFGAH